MVQIECRNRAQQVASRFADPIIKHHSMQFFLVYVDVASPLYFQRQQNFIPEVKMPTNRLLQLLRHLTPSDTLGEEQHPLLEDESVPTLPRKGFFRFTYDRRPIKIPVREVGGGGVNDKYGGIQNAFVLEGELLVPNGSSPECRTVLVFMHPAATMNLLPMPVGLARAGCHVMLCGSRYAGSDRYISISSQHPCATADLVV